MIVRRDLGDLRKAYRPYRIEELYGQPRVVKTIKHWFSENSVPQMLLFSGPPGTGKISTAKIIAMRLLCKNWSNGTPCFDCTECRAVFQENRISDFTVYTPSDYKKLDAFIDDFRYGTPRIHYSSDGGKIIAFDEFHVVGLDTQRWLLGQFIKYPNNNYIVCSSNPTEILEDIRKKLSSIEFDKVDGPEIRNLIENVCADLIIDPKCDAVNKIIKGADGSPERALNSIQNKHWLKKLNPIISGEIKCIPGKGRILVVAPHAVPGDENDDLTGVIARKIQQRENCYTIINEKYSKNEVNLNNLDSIDAMPKLNIKADFLDPIRNFKDEIKKQGLEPLIVYIHGIKDENIFEWGEEDTKILIGYGQDKEGDENRPQSLTLSASEIESIKEALSYFDLGGVLAPVESRYCAREKYNLNQLFQQDRYQGYYDQTVKSVQLEIRKNGMREDPIQAVEVGINIGMALRIFFKNLGKEQPKTAPQIEGTKIESVKRQEGQSLKNEETKPQPQDEKTPTEKDEKGSAKVDVLSVPTRKGVSKKANKGQNGIEEAPDKSLVADSLKQLSGFFNGGYHAAMQQAGDFIIEKFYGREPERVIGKKPVLKESLFSLIKELQKGKNKVPSKSWFYNARDLAAHEQIFKKRGFQIFGNLGHSHKLALLPVRDLEKIEALATEAIKNGYNVEDLKNRIKEENGSSGINLTTVPTKADLAKLERKERLQLQKKAERKIEHHQKKLDHFQRCLEEIKSVREPNEPSKGKLDTKEPSSKIEILEKLPPSDRVKKFSGWDKVEIEKSDGTKVAAIAPVIISASRHTDIPAFYGERLMNALKRGYLERPMPRNPDKTEYISFEKTRLIVFWTKNHEPLFRCLDEIDKMGIGYYFQYTLNNYEAEGYEPNIPPLKQRIKVFKTLSKRIGPEKVVWRFDPLILSDLISEKKLIEKVQGVMNQLSGHTRKMVISFFKAKNHAKDVRKLIKKKIQCEDFDAEFGYVATKIGKMCAQNGIEVGACAGGQDLTRYGIAMNKCIDDGLMKRVFAQDERLMAFIGDGQGLKHPGQREYCECIVSRDIGGPNTCSHLCAYCYATDSDAAVKKNLERIDQSGEMLLPIIKKGSDLDHSRDGKELPN